MKGCFALYLCGFILQVLIKYFFVIYQLFLLVLSTFNYVPQCLINCFFCVFEFQKACRLFAMTPPYNPYFLFFIYTVVAIHIPRSLPFAICYYQPITNTFQTSMTLYWLLLSKLCMHSIEKNT